MAPSRLVTVPALVALALVLASLGSAPTTSLRDASATSTTSVVPSSARSTAMRETAGPHIIPWPQAQATEAPATSVPSRSTSGPVSGK